MKFLDNLKISAKMLGVLGLLGAVTTGLFIFGSVEMRAIDTEYAGLTDRLARLERAGLVLRSRSAADARSLLVELTDAGRRVAEAAFRQDMAAEKALLAGLNEAERLRLASLLAKLARSLGGSA